MTFTINIPMWLVYVSGVVIAIPVLFFAWVGFMYTKEFSGGIWK